jgi:hypothetical protein
MSLLNVALFFLPWLLIAIPFVVWILCGPVGALSIFALPFLAGTWAVLRATPEGVFCPYNLSRKYPRLEALLEKRKVDDWFGVLGGAPAVFSVFAGLIVFGFRCFGWLATATWKPVSVRAVWGWPAAAGDVATGLRGLDQIVWVDSRRRAARTLANLNSSFALDCCWHSA